MLSTDEIQRVSKIITAELGAPYTLLVRRGEKMVIVTTMNDAEQSQALETWKVDDDNNQTIKGN